MLRVAELDTDVVITWALHMGIEEESRAWDQGGLL